jgi:hypothetical protein
VLLILLACIAGIVAWYMIHQGNLLRECAQDLALCEREITEGDLNSARNSLNRAEMILHRFGQWYNSIFFHKSRLTLSEDLRSLQQEYGKRLTITSHVLSSVTANISQAEFSQALKNATAFHLVDILNQDKTLHLIETYVCKLNYQSFRKAEEVLDPLCSMLPPEVNPSQMKESLLNFIVTEKKTNEEYQARVAQAVGPTIHQTDRHDIKAFNPRMVGRAIIWDYMRGQISQLYELLPDELRASSRDDSVTVFGIINEEEVPVGYYYGAHSILGARAYQQKIEIAVVYWPKKVNVGTAVVWSAYPPPKLWGLNELMGSASWNVAVSPEDIVQWITGLPRR